jgi:hypothetical protein
MVRINSGAACLVLLLLMAGNTDSAAAQAAAARQAALHPAAVLFAEHASVEADFETAPMATAGSYRVIGAAAGFVIGGGLTWIVIHQGDSTSLCDRSANQDAIRANECLAIAAGGAVVGAALGYFIGSRIRRERQGAAPFDALRVGVAPQRSVRIGWQLAY